MVFPTNRLKIHVKRGLNLAIRGATSRDPYVLIKMGNQKLKTRVVERNINPEWNEHLAFSISDPHLPVLLFVHDNDTFFDGKMGEAEFDINPFLEATKTRQLVEEGVQDGTIITTIEPNRRNCLAEESQIVWRDGKVVQNMFLRLKKVGSGQVEVQLSMENILGLLRIRVERGVDLATRDFFTRSSDPFIVFQMGNQKLKTRVVRRSLNPEWNEELTLFISDTHLPVHLFVYDKDRVFDDKMGEAEFDINPFLEAVKTRQLVEEGVQDGAIITTIEPNRQNCLAEESQIVWRDGKVVQNMFLRLKKVECGQVEVQLLMDNILGLLGIRVQRGVDLAIRDFFIRSSDPFIVFQMGNQKLKTRVVRRSLNPEWNEELTLCVSDPPLPVQLFVYDKDIGFNDKLGEAEFDINPFVQAVVRQQPGGLPHGGAILQRIKPNRGNCLAEESQIVWKDGQIVQDLVLRLKNVESGEVELQLYWAHFPPSNITL